MSVEQAPERGLRVAVHRIGLVVARAADGRPALLVEIRVEAGQHDGAFGQARDHAHEVCGRRHRARRARDDDRMVGTLAGEALRFRLQQGVAALRRIARLALGQNLGPVLARDLHEVARDLEIGRVIGIHRQFEGMPVDAFRGEGVHQGLEIAREVHRIGGRGRHHEGHLGAELQQRPVHLRRPALHEAREDEAALQRRDRGLEARGLLQRRAFEPRQLELGLVGLAQRHDARQELRPAFTALGQQRDQRAGGAAVRNIDRDVGQRRGIVG